ncbi:MAG: ATP-dependent RecD-like DNA helicase [Chlamydiales bacterium]
MNTMEEISGSVLRITYQNPENGYTVAKLEIPGSKDPVCAVGSLPTIQPGESIRCCGQWKHHLVHGLQFIVHSYRTEVPATTEAITKYLGSGLIKGIGPTYAKKITETFGKETLQVVDTDPDSLNKVPGIGKKRIDTIKKCWNEQKSIRELMLYLQSYEISPTHAQKIYKTYGDYSVAIIQENPFRLAKEIMGIGFKTADGMAQKMGVEKTSSQRVDAGIEHVLSELSNEGHVCYPLEPFLTCAAELLDVAQDLIAARIPILDTEGRIKVAKKLEGDEKKTFIWLMPLYRAEKGIACEMWRIKKGTSALRDIHAEKAISWVESKLNITLGKDQRKAVAKVLNEKIHIITGGPGTGKSTITNAFLTILNMITSEICLVAPTGRAAKRMAEITGRKAQTIHSLLEYDFRINGFKRNRKNPLDCDLIVVDEASMIDTLLLYSLLRALPDKARVVLIGDINQLPSVGPGNVLKDLIEVHFFSLTRLKEIYRQAQGSKIITNAHRINQGIFPDLENHPKSDFYFIPSEDREEILKEIVSLVKNRLPQTYGLNPIRDIQVLAPMKKGAIGIDQLNQVLQHALNKGENPLIRMGRSFLPKDKVMQIRNNYKKEVYNGDVGTVEKIDWVEQVILINFEGRIVEYEFSEMDELVLAYAVSIHKYQGSESPCIIIPIHTSHFMMLRRNLIYTGITRGKNLVILIGSKRAIAIAVKNDDVAQRHTGLKEFLKGGVND